MGAQKTVRKSIKKNSKDRIQQINRDLCIAVSLKGIIGYLVDGKNLSEEENKTDELANTYRYLDYYTKLLNAERTSIVEQAADIHSRTKG